MSGGVSPDDLDRRLSAGDAKFAELTNAHNEFRTLLTSFEGKLSDHTKAVDALTIAQQHQAEAQERQAEMVQKLAEIQDAWVAVKGTGNFIIWWGKVVSGLLLGLASMLALIKFQLLSVLSGGPHQ